MTFIKNNCTVLPVHIELTGIKTTHMCVKLVMRIILKELSPKETFHELGSLDIKKTLSNFVQREISKLLNLAVIH